ncbi:MAG: NlpC/P60 family protein [Smithellaceae bacterium]|nr:NlpC/P60 family protein [Smithellaceae bacterium]
MANELLGEPYGWGGLNQNRDCSALTMDIFSPFGLWLPRNSGDQAHLGGTFYDLSNLPAAEKNELIRSKGVPYATLLWRKGHIMLYIGESQGRILIFHNFWGIRIKDANGKVGKMIFGRAAITTLRPGAEFYSDNEEDNPLDGIMGMTLLIPPPRHPDPFENMG